MQIYRCSPLSEEKRRALIREISEKMSPEAAELLICFLGIEDELIDLLNEKGEAALIDVMRIASRMKAEARKKDAEQLQQQPEQQDQQPEKQKPQPENAAPGNKKDKKKKKKKEKPAKAGSIKRGRNGKEDYPEARVKEHAMGPALCAGSNCPCRSGGKLYSLPPSHRIILEARPLVKAVRHEAERLRCSSCGSVFAANLPAEVTEVPLLHRATPQAASASILARYALGMPDLRLEKLQDWMHTPLSNSTQWAISLEGFLRLKSFLIYVTGLARDAQSMQADDAHTKVVTLQGTINTEVSLAQNAGFSERDVRTGLQTTWIVARITGGHELHLCMTGREHQGEVCYELLKERNPELPPAVLTTDAVAKATALRPFPRPNGAGFVSSRRQRREELSPLQVTHSFCLQHLRLAFEDVENNHPREVEFVLSLIGAVYTHEREIKHLGLSATERLAFHQQHSAPLMDALHVWMKTQFEQRSVEPNSDLGRAVSYGLNQWHGMTAFLRTENVELDTNPCERNVYFTILHRLNSLHYQTANGALVGDAFMGLAATCRSANVNPFEYLSALLSFSDDTKRHPELWLPWNYSTRFSELLEERNREWKEIDERRLQRGYRQCVRILENHTEKQSPYESECFMPAI